MNILFLMDPLHTVIPHKDTTLALMVAAHERGHKAYYLPDGGISRQGAKTIFHAVSVVPGFNPDNPFTQRTAVTLSEDDTDIIFIRSDPPFDAQYLTNTWLLDLLPARIAVINKPSGVRATNEKIWATRFAGLLPPNCVSRNRKVIQEFINEAGEVVVKPTDGFGGQSVFHIKKNDTNKNVILETLSRKYSVEIILQQYVPEAVHGDKRILLLNGEPLGAVLRKQAEDDHRHNFFSGGKPFAAEITKRDREIISTLKPFLVERGLYFAGIDILGEYLTEVNVTSPTCLQEMNELYNLKLHHQVVEFAEEFAKKNT